MVDLPKAKVDDINKNAPKLAKWFYINNKKKVSYYVKSAFNTHFKVYNAGSDAWEYASEMTEDRLRPLPALCQAEYDDIYSENKDEPSISEVLSLGNVSKAEQYAAEVDTLVTSTDAIESEVVVTKILCNTTPPVEKQIKRKRDKEKTPVTTDSKITVAPNSFSITFVEEPKKEEEDKTSSSSQIDQNKLFNLFKQNLPEGFILRFTPQELNYYIAYNHQSHTWTHETSTQIQTIGTIYTNSLTCIRKVVDHLNTSNITL